MTTLLAICETIAHWLAEPAPADPGWPAAAWDNFKLASRVHGTAPLLYEQLKQSEWLDGSIRSWLAGQHEANSQRVALMHRELGAILALFGGNDLAVLPLKGAILSAFTYPDPGLRPMADLDLLIRPADLDRAAGLLARLGYTPEVVHWKHTGFSRPDNRQVVDPDCEHPDNPRRLEVHTYCRETFGGPTIDLTGLMWAGANPGPLLGQPALLPSAEALWLHLLVHTTYHAWQGKGRLLHLLDLRRVTPSVREPGPLLASVDARYTYPALVLLEKYCPGTLDPALLAAQRRRVTASFDRWAGSLDLVTMSHLNPRPPGLYLLKALRFSGGRPGEVLQALRFACLPALAELALDHPRLARSRVPWLAYTLLPWDWFKRLAFPERK